MSQHKFYAMHASGNPFLVSIGYDRPLNYVHCIVMSTSLDLLYSNLDDENAGTTLQDVRYYKGVLESLGIKLPESIYEQVERDQMLRVGNRVVTYNKDGSIATEKVG